jgi:hypothetical protein
MTTREQLVQAVIADPDADAPREAFAAWGVAHGDRQGELARIQLAEAHERRVGIVSEAHRRYLEAYDLLEKHEKTWAHEVLSIVRQVRFYRGFVELVSIDVPTFLSHASQLYALAPIRSVQFLDAGPHVDALAASEYLERLVSVEFYNKSHAAPLGDAGLRKLVASPHLGKVVMLSVPLNDIGANGVEALAASVRLPRLRYAALGNNPVDDPAEQCAFDAISHEVNRNSIVLPPFGRALEVKYGDLPWLHAASRFRMFPPDLHDV